MARVGIRVIELYHPEHLKRQIRRNVEEKNRLLQGLYDAAPLSWEEIYEEAILTTNLEQVAGIDVTARRAGERVTDTYGITRRNLLQIVRQVEALTPGFEMEDISSQEFAAIGARIRQYDAGYLQRYGLSTKDLLQMELGGPGAAETAAKAKRLLATQEAFYEPRATTQSLVQSGQLQQQEERPQGQ